MKMKVRTIVAALWAVGIVGPVHHVSAQSIVPTTTTLNPQSPSAPATYTVTYPVTFTLTGGQPQTVNFTYSCTASGCAWVAPANFTQTSTLNANNTVTFSSTQNNVTFGIALSSTGPNFNGTASSNTSTFNTTPPSVASNYTNVNTTTV